MLVSTCAITTSGDICAGFEKPIDVELKLTRIELAIDSAPAPTPLRWSPQLTVRVAMFLQILLGTLSVKLSDYVKRKSGSGQHLPHLQSYQDTNQLPRRH